MLTPYYTDEQVTVHHGDCLEVLRGLPDCSVDAVVTDPPYGISFMGQAWDQPDSGHGSQRKNGKPGPHLRRPGVGDHKKTTARDGAMEAGRYDLSPHAMLNFQRWCTEWAAECLRVLKPGGHLLAFGGSRTWHRLACAVEDAGFEIRDSIAWIYGSGFPKSLDVSKSIDKAAGHWRGRATAVESENSAMSGGNYGRTPKGTPITPAAAAGYGTALKPAFEPIVVGRKPLAGTVAANWIDHGTGALNIDACRVGMSPQDAAAINAKHAGMDPDRYERPAGVALNLSVNPMPLRPAQAHSLGRWPTNVLLEESQAAELDRQTGVTVRIGQPRGAAAGDGWGMTATGAEYSDAGGASRFFPVFRYESKANSAERPFYYRPTCECEDSWPTTPTRSAARVTDATTEPASSSTSKSGSATTGNQSPTGTKSTTLTGTSSTTTRATTSRVDALVVGRGDCQENSGAASGGSPAGSAASSSRSERPTGTSAPKAGPSTEGAARATSPAWSAISVCGGCGAPTRREAHATVKPLDLMRWLVRLVTPPGGVVLDPFAGSGTTAEACVIEGFRCVLIEREAGYLPLIVSRLTKPLEPVLDFTRETTA